MSITVGLLHPGEMGGVVGRVARAAGARVLWTSAGRSGASRARAAGAGLEDAGALADVVRASDVILSVCPPHGALDVARAVAAERFTGLFVDANAVSPETTREIGRIVEKGGARFVDGGIVGPPPETPGTTRLYLSGAAAAEVARLFAGTALEPVVVEGGPGAASAVKAAYAAWNKGWMALVMAVRALARAEGVEPTLLAEWERSQPGLVARSQAAAAGSARKAWRWIGEMEEIAAAFAADGLPDGFHLAAAEIYRRMERYRDAAEAPSIEEVARALAGK